MLDDRSGEGAGRHTDLLGQRERDVDLQVRVLAGPDDGVDLGVLLTQGRTQGGLDLGGERIDRRDHGA